MLGVPVSQAAACFSDACFQRLLCCLPMLVSTGAVGDALLRLILSHHIQRLNMLSGMCGAALLPEAAAPRMPLNAGTLVCCSSLATWGDGTASPLLQATDSVEAFVMGLLEKGFGTGEEAAEVELLQKLLQVSRLEKMWNPLQAMGARTCAAPVKQWH